MFDKVKTNWKSGFTVALVSVPVSMCLAVAFSVPPEKCIITAVWGGLISALLGGSHFNVIGASGALSGAILSFVLVHGAPATSMLAIMAGLFILFAYVCRAERYLIFIPSSVIHGFTLGVACIIALRQIRFACGLPRLPMHKEFIDNVWEAIRHLPDASLVALAVFGSFLILLAILRRYTPGLPGTIICSAIGIIFGSYFAEMLQLETLGSRYGEVCLSLFQPPTLFFSWDLIVAALTVALIAMSETVLSAKVADGLTKTKHNTRKEVFALGLANIISGLAGGLPATALHARTALNIKSGATHRASAVLSSLMLGFIAMIFLPWLKSLPLTVVAAVLVSIAISMIEAKPFGRLYRHDKASFWISILVAIITVATDASLGILVGAVLSLLFFLEKLSRGHYDLSVRHSQQGHSHATAENLDGVLHHDGAIVYSFKGKISYINGQAHLVRCEAEFKQCQKIVLCLRDLYFIDIDGIDTLDAIIDIAHKRHEKIVLASVNPCVKSLLKTASQEYLDLESQGLVFETTAEALHYLCAQPA